MTANVALNFAPRTTRKSVRKVSARRLVRARVLPALRPILSRPVALAPSVNARVESVLMGVTFAALAGLAVLMEAVGTSLL
jgi:hypothetical protein